MFWVVSFVPVTVAGVIAMWREGLSFSELNSSSTE